MPVINRRQITVSRADVAEWLSGKGERDTEHVVREKLEELGLQDTSVDMGDTLGVMTLADVILEEFRE